MRRWNSLVCVMAPGMIAAVRVRSKLGLTLILLMSALACLSNLLPASAQVCGILKAKTNRVYAGRDPQNLQETELGQLFAAGDTIQTGRRSQALIEFNDKSVLRINESTKVLIGSGTVQSDVAIIRVYGKSNSPRGFRRRRVAGGDWNRPKKVTPSFLGKSPISAISISN